jgi:elongation factor 2
MLKATKGMAKEEIFKMTDKVGLQLSSEERALEGKELMRNVMMKWLPVGDAMLEMIIVHLPSPEVAQKYRTDILYEGPNDDEVAIGKTSSALPHKIVDFVLTYWKNFETL